MAKQDEHRFNLRFDEDDENHRRVSAYLNQCGRKKARYIVKAILAYWELQDGKMPVVEQLEMKHFSEKESAVHKRGEQNKADRLIQVEDVKDRGLDQDEADLMRQNYAMFGDMQ